MFYLLYTYANKISNNFLVLTMDNESPHAFHMTSTGFLPFYASIIEINTTKINKKKRIEGMMLCYGQSEAQFWDLGRVR